MTTTIRSFTIEPGTRWIDTKQARTTGTFVTVLEDLRDDAPEGCKWLAKCEDHGWVGWTETRRQAHQLATEPDEFCDECADLSPIDVDLEFEVGE